MNLPKGDAPVKAFFDLAESLCAGSEELARVVEELVPFVRTKGNNELAAMLVNSVEFFKKQCGDEALANLLPGDGALLNSHMNSLKNLLRWWATTNYP